MQISQTVQNDIKETSASINILKVSIPVALSQLLLILGSFISTFYLSFLSPSIFAASMLFTSVQLLFIQVPFSLLFCMSPMISHYVGRQKQLYEVGVLFRAAILLSLLISIVIMLMLGQIKPILLMFREPPGLVDICSQYFHTFLWVMPFSAVSRVCLQLAMGLFKQKIVFLATLLSLIFFAVIAYILIFGKFGLPAMSFTGLALAYILQSLFNVVFFLVYFLYNQSFAEYQLFAVTQYKNLMHYFNKIASTGLPISLQTGNELLSFFITTLLVGYLGASALMAKQITVQYLLLLVVPLFGIGQASATFVAKSWGEGKCEQMKFYGNLSIKIGVIYSVIITLLFVCMPTPFIKVFVHTTNLPHSFFALVANLLVIVAIGQIFDSIRSISVGSLRGLGDTKFPLVVSILGIWLVGLPLAYLFGFTFHGGVIGITLGHSVCLLLSSFILWRRWHKRAAIVVPEL